MVQFLRHKGLADAQINDSFKDHMALRSPNIASGISLTKRLIDSGAYNYKTYLLSNHPDQQKPVIQKIQIAGKDQVAVSLCATPLSLTYGLPQYLFVSMRDCGLTEPDLFVGLDRPFDTNKVPELHHDPYWGPAEQLTKKKGALSANHFTLSINRLVALGGCKDIHDFRDQILQIDQCEENTALTVKNCPDVQQFALLGSTVYVEYSNVPP